MFNTLGRCSAWLVCVMIAASLCGCADTAAVKKAAPGESVVFGRVAAVYNGNQVENLQGMSISGSSFVLLKIGETDGKLINLPGDGAFAWALPPGEYMLVEFQYFTEGARRTLDLRAKFLVPDRPVSVYIGLLRVTYKHGAQAAGLEDDFDGAVAQLRQTDESAGCGNRSQPPDWLACRRGRHRRQHPIACRGARTAARDRAVQHRRRGNQPPAGPGRHHAQGRDLVLRATLPSE